MQNNVHLFWSRYGVNDWDLNSWRSKTARLSPFHLLPLLSQAKKKNNVTLWSYQSKFSYPIPDGITIRDADDIFPAELALKALKAGHSIAHISDLVRLMACSETDGIMIDMDAVLLRQYPKVKGFLSSGYAKKTGGMAIKWGKKRPPMKIHDGSWDGKALSMFPAKAHTGISQDFKDIAVLIADKLGSPPGNGSQGWNYVMWEMKKIYDKDPASKIFPPISFCPVIGWLGKGSCYSIQVPTKFDGKTTVFGNKFPSLGQILKESYVVQHFFESAFKGGAIFSNHNFWANIHELCLVAYEAKKVLGSNWRKILTEGIER